MRRYCLVLLWAGALSGCAQMPEWAASLGLAPAAAPAPASGAAYRFGWSLSGEPGVAPLQVFDNGRHTWLQFAPGQPLPAIFVHGARGQRLVHGQPDGAFLRLDGVWPELMFRGGRLRAFARPDPAEPAEPAPGPVGAAAEPLAEEAAAEPVAQALPVQLEAAVPPATAAGPLFQLRLQDHTLRQALARWARDAGWTFSAEHWALDIDVPVAGEARFGPGFEDAVHDLLDATTLGDWPLQACFYSNRVLRVVPQAQACDRSHRLAAS